MVVFEAGLGNDGSVWKQVQAEVGHVTRACVYDRAGMGSSGPGRKPRTSRQMVAELHALLAGARLPAPYVLVGHSAGGLNVQLYAIAHPAEVAGMVLVDAVSGTVDSRFFALLPPEKIQEFQAGLRALPDGWDFDTYRESMAQVRASVRSLGGIPLVVLTRGKNDPPEPGISPELAVRMQRVWGEIQAELPKLSSNGIQIVAKNSGHFIQSDAPKLVVAAVDEVVQGVRTGSPVDVKRLSAFAGEGLSP
jgi:pimeloyl-ACP methyl ester carboxylesterase